MKLIPSLAALACLLAAPAMAADVVHVAAPGAAIASVVTVPAKYDMVYVSGMVPAVADPKAPAGSTATYGGDTKTQTLSVLSRIDEALKSQGVGFGDVVMMRVLLVGDPALDGKMDFAGMMAAYTQFFGTAAQPNKPARITSQVVSLVGPGMLVEIEVQAARKPK
jgi:enamine deaminase RidA (YjgF/YER057c/UK114 family)